MSLLSDRIFPRNPGAIGSELAGAPGPGIADFEGIEHPNWPSLNGGRMVYATDPAGSGATVLRWELRDGDVCDHQYGPDGQRLEMWTPSGYKAENVQGAEGAYCFRWYLGDGVKGDLFRYPSVSWALMFQHHDGGGSPPQALETRNGKWVWVTRASGSQAGDYREIGDCTRGHWHYFVNTIRFSNQTDGYSRLWHAIDGPPDTSKPPVDERLGIRTLYGNGNGITTLHMYRADGPPADYPWVAYSGLFARSGTIAAARKLAGWDAITPPSPAPSPAKAQAAINAIVGNTKIVAAIQETLNYAKATT